MSLSIAGADGTGKGGDGGAIPRQGQQMGMQCWETLAVGDGRLEGPLCSRESMGVGKGL